MFTGIIQALGTLETVEPAAGGAARWWLSCPALGGQGPGPAEGESIAVNGCCLTVAQLQRQGERLRFDLSPETLKKTTAGVLKAGDRVNLERALRAGDSLGGHFVAGHVDGVGRVLARRQQGEGCEMDFEIPAALARYVAEKGSVALDGVSLTPFSVMENRFSVALIPHTLEQTTLGGFEPGHGVNVEIDLLARYVGRLMEEKP